MGGGPAGAAAAFWAASGGLDVLVLEKKDFPRPKTCGDGLTPRSVKQLADMGLGPQLEEYHKFKGLRTSAHGRTLELPWPDHSIFPSHGYVAVRSELDQMVLENAQAAGAQVRYGAEAVSPILIDGLCKGVVVLDRASGERSNVEARYLILAEGANSRIGRTLGCRRDRSYPQGMAIRTYFASPRHDDPWIESVLDVRDRNGEPMPGYGWIFPLGDGSVNIGIGLLSTYKNYRSVNTSWLMEEWTHAVRDFWDINPEDPLNPPVGGRLPMAGSVEPKAGPNFLMVGDAAGYVNPFNGEGIDYAYETGRLAAELVAESVICNDGLTLSYYPELLQKEYGLYFKVARLFAQVIGRPSLMSRLTRAGMQSQALMEGAFRIMANLMGEDESGPAEKVYRSLAWAARFWPE